MLYGGDSKMEQSDNIIWNSALETLRDKLSDKIDVEYGLFEEDDIHYVEWDEIEQAIDKLKE